MRPAVLFTLPFLGLSACVTPEQDVARAAALCGEAGRKAGSLAYEQCLERQVEQFQLGRNAAAEAFVTGLQNPIYTAPTPAPSRRPVETRCWGEPPYVRCRTY